MIEFIHLTYRAWPKTKHGGPREVIKTIETKFGNTAFITECGYGRVTMPPDHTMGSHCYWHGAVEITVAQYQAFLQDKESLETLTAELEAEANETE